MNNIQNIEILKIILYVMEKKINKFRTLDENSIKNGNIIVLEQIE